MPLTKDGAVAPDPWRLIGQEEDIPAGQPVILDLGRLEAEAEHLFHRRCCLGVLMRPGDPAERLAPWAATAPGADRALGRARRARAGLLEAARALRQRHGFMGEIRALRVPDRGTAARDSPCVGIDRCYAREPLRIHADL